MSENLDFDDACNATIDLGDGGIHLCILRPGHTEPHRHNAFFAAVKKAQADEGDFQGIMEDRIHKELGKARPAFPVRMNSSMDDAPRRYSPPTVSDPIDPIIGYPSKALLDFTNNLRQHYCPPGTPTFTTLYQALHELSDVLFNQRRELDATRP